MTASDGSTLTSVTVVVAASASGAGPITAISGDAADATDVSILLLPPQFLKIDTRWLLSS